MRLWSLLLIVSLSGFAMSDLEGRVPLLVNRRIMFDTYVCANTGNLMDCQADANTTYLVSERRCVKDQELLGECNFAFASSEGLTNFTTAIAFRLPNDTELTTAAVYNHNYSSTFTSATIRPLNSSTHGMVNGSYCHISSLDVYRGMDDITQIESEGLSLSDAGTLSINHSSLAYNSDEYLGELYRMSLLCSNEPQTSCLFFKVIGRTNLTNDKFNSRVKGIFDDSTTEMPESSGPEDHSTSPPSSATTSRSGSHHTTAYSETEITPNSSNAANTFEIGSPGFYIIAGVAGGIFILVATILVLSMIVGCLATNKRDPCTSTTVTTQLHLHNLVQLQVETPDSPAQQGSMNNFLNSDDETSTAFEEKENPCYIHNETKAAIPTDQGQESTMLWELGSRNFTTNHPKSRTIALESAKSPKKVDLGISRSQANSLNSITFETFKPKVSSEKRKRPSSWTAPGQDASNFSGDDEEQIYDTVAPFTMASVETRGKTMSDYATISTSVNLGTSDSVYDVPRKAVPVPVYNVPCAGKRRPSKRVRNRCKSEEMMSLPLSTDSHLVYDVPRKIYSKKRKQMT